MFNDDYKILLRDMWSRLDVLRTKRTILEYVGYKFVADVSIVFTSKGYGVVSCIIIVGVKLGVILGVP